MSSIPAPRTVLRPIGRLLLAIGVVLVLLTTAFTWWAWNHGQDWLEDRVRSRITEAIDKASVQGYFFTMQDLETDARTGRLVVSGVDLDFAPELLDSLRSGAFRYLFAAKADRIELRGLSFWRLLWNGEFRVNAFELHEPALTYLIGGQRVGLVDPFVRLDHGSNPLSLLAADTLVVRNASAVVEDLGERLPRLFVSGLDLAGSAVQVTMGELRGGVRLTVGGAELLLDSLRTQLPDGDQLSIGQVRLSRSGSSGHVREVRMRSDRLDSTRTDLVRRALLDVSMDSILLTGLDVDHLITDQALRIAHMQVHGMHLHVELDKTLPEGAVLSKQLPPAALLALPFPIRIDTLTLVNAEAFYDERDGTTERWGVIPFEQVQARFLHITNETEAIAQHQRITGEFSGLLFNGARVIGTYDAELDRSERYVIHATAVDLPLQNVNSATRPLLRVQVNGGTLHRLELLMEGNDRRAKGIMALHYSDLLFRVEPGTSLEMRHSMFGSVIETMLKETYGGGLSAERERSYSVERDPTSSLITFLWHATREGLARNLAPEAMGRMRSMLRADAEQRREQRELRKQRKQERQEER